MRDMTVGKPLPLIMKFAFPLLISNFFQQLYSISDILLVGHLIGVKALAAVGAAAPLFFFLVMACIGFTNGLTVIAAQSFGAKDFVKLRRSVVTATFLSFTFTIIFSSVVYLLLDRILILMNVPQEIYMDTRAFLRILCCGVIMIVSFNFLSGLMRALGDSKTPLYFLIFTTLLNIVFNVIFIYFCKMGVKGSSLGTVSAMSVSVIACLIYITKHFTVLLPHRQDLFIKWNFCKQHLKIALPMAVQFSIIAVGAAITQTICNKFGFVTIAAMTAAMRIEQVAGQPMVSLGIAMSTYVAQNYGAKKIARLRRGVWQSSLVSFAASLFLAFLVFVFGREIVGVFVPKEQPELVNEIISLARTYLKISVIFYFFLGQIFIFRNSCQGMGNSVSPMISSLVELFMRAFAAIYLTQFYGFVGLCFASPLAWIGGALVVSVGYFRTIIKVKAKIAQKRGKLL